MIIQVDHYPTPAGSKLMVNSAGLCHATRGRMITSLQQFTGHRLVQVAFTSRGTLGFGIQRMNGARGALNKYGGTMRYLLFKNVRNPKKAIGH